MVRVARTREPQKLSFVRNPAGGSILAAAAGGQAEAELDFTNDSPDVAAFELAVDGLPAGWLGGVGSAFGTMAAASGGGALRLSLTPPLDAPVGEYDFTVQILSGGDAIAPATKLILRVEPPDEAALLVADPAVPILPPPLPEPVAEIAPTPEPATPKPVTRRRTPVVAALIPIAEAAPVPDPPIVTPTPVARVPEPEPVVFAPEPKPAPRPEQVLPKPRPVAPPPTPEPEPVALVPEVVPATPVVRAAQALPKPRPAAPPEPEPVLVDYKPSFTPYVPPEEEEETSAREEEPSVLDLPDGGAVALKPGETKLLRFAFTNETPREVTYVLDEDRSLPDSWITLVQDQVNLTRNGKGDVALRLSPPLNAEPGDYPFAVTLGPQGSILTPRSLTLTVQATAAVRLSTKETTIKIGPMASFADFHLTIESAGNADTAFRLGVRAPQTDDSPHSATPLYETLQWRYLFDKELETLRAPATGRAPRPVPIRLRLQRKGPWWFGFRETHQVHVAAVPVTEPANSGKPGNDLTVTAVRQRFWPMPYLTLIPLFLLFLLLTSGGPGDFSVTDAQHEENDTYWVVNPPGGTSKQATMKWTSATPLLRLSGEKISGDQASREGSGAALSQVVLGSSSLPQSVPVSPKEPDVEYHYKVSRLIGGGDRDVFVHYIYNRSDTPFQPSYQEAGHKAFTAISGSDVTLTIPKNGPAHLRLRNGAVTQHGDTLDLNYWIVHQPNAKTSAFELQGIVPQGTIPQQQAKTPVIVCKPSGDLEDNQIVIVTSDSHHPLLTVTLKKEGADTQ